jgi:organic hydroperoxide reductase OsmC/OhrA
MSEYTAVITWARDGAAFTDNRYSRGHRWSFDGGIEVAASASPHVVPLPLSVAAAVDPEEAFVAALASCHMLWFLSIAAKRGFVVESYRDAATGVMAKNAAGKVAMTKGHAASGSRVLGQSCGRAPAQHQAMHHEAHEQCFIANSVTTDVRCDPVDISA